MGNYSVILILAAVLSGTSLMVMTSVSTVENVGEVDEPAFRAMAREASLNGLDMSTRRLVEDSGSWYLDPAKYEFHDEAWRYSTFSTRVETLYARGPVFEGCAIDTVDVVAVGESLAGISHQTRATYVRTCTPDGPSSAFAFAASHERGLEVNGETAFYSSDPGTSVSILPSEPIKIPAFVPQVYLDAATYVDDGNVEIDTSATIDFTNYRGITTHGSEENPFVWYIKGGLTISADSLWVIGHGLIITEGYVSINDGTQVLSSIANGERLPESKSDNPNEGIVRTWIAGRMADGVTLGIYAGGTKDDDPDEPGIYLGGNQVVTAQLFASGTVYVDGSATVYGAIISKSEVRFKGKNVVWFNRANESIILPGMFAFRPDGIRMIGYKEG